MLHALKLYSGSKGPGLCKSIDVACSLSKRIGVNALLLFFLVCPASAQESLRPETVFREYSYSKMVNPFKGEYAAYDSFQVVLEVGDLKNAVDAEVALNFWGGHIGTSDQTFKVNGSRKFDFPQPKTPGSPYCYFRFGVGNPPVKIPVKLLKSGKNTFTFFCGKQVCYSFNWPLYWLNSFTIRVFYDKDRKQLVKGKVRKRNPQDTAAYNLVVMETDVDDPKHVESVEYIGFYDDYDVDGDGILANWHYTLNNGVWSDIIGKQTVEPYSQKWNNNWLPQQDRPVKVVAKINSKNGLSYISAPLTFEGIRQRNSTVKIYRTNDLGENFASRVNRRKECTIRIDDDLTNAVSAYIVFSSWSGESEDGAIHTVGINGKMLAESPGKLHDYAFVRIPVPLEYLKTGDNIFYVYSETEEHMFEINYPGPAMLVRYSPAPTEAGN